MSYTAKQRILRTLDKADDKDILSKRFDQFIMALILLNVAAVIIETVDSIQSNYKLVLGFERFGGTLKLLN